MINTCLAAHAPHQLSTANMQICISSGRITCVRLRSCWMGIQAQSMLDGKVVPCTAWSTHEGLLGSDHTGWVSFHSLDCSKCKAPRFEGTAAVCFRIGHPLDGLAKIIGAPGAKQERVGKKGERSKGQHAQDAAFGFIHPLLSWQGVKSSRLKA
eukprot:scaffold61177_cov23-Tisochrysis_lutea.AAC.1